MYIDHMIFNPDYNPDPIISRCGDDCAVCPRYLAKTDEQCRAIAEFWYKAGWRDHLMSNSEIPCCGCMQHSSCNCSYNLLDCTIEHNVTQCPNCHKFPCSKIEAIVSRTTATKEQCRALCTSPEEFAVFERAFCNKAKNLGLQ